MRLLPALRHARNVAVAPQWTITSNPPRPNHLARRDTAGQERYLSLAPLYYRGAHAAAIVYDMTNSDSFDKAKYWVSELQRNASSTIGGRRAWGPGAGRGGADGGQGQRTLGNSLMSVHTQTRARALAALNPLRPPSVPLSPPPPAVMVLVANKSDLSEQRQVSAEEGAAWAAQ